MLKNKGIFDLYETVKKINKSGILTEQLVLDFVGDGADLVNLEDLINKENSKFTNLFGWIDDQKLMIDKLSTSTLLVCPSLSQYPEGVPRVIDEALSCNTPVLCSDHQSIVNYVHKDMILFFKTNDIENLELKILEFFQEANVRTNLLKTISAHNKNKDKKSAAQQHAEILLGINNAKKNSSKKMNLESKIADENISEKFINSLSSTRTLAYIKNRLIELIYRYSFHKEPWLTPSANKKLNSLIKKNFVGFEFGSGKSTLWFARRCASISSIETSEFWRDKILKIAESENLNNIKIYLVDEFSRDFQHNYLKKKRCKK